MTLEQLLVVQVHDSAIDQLTHRRANLPEMQAIADCDDERTHLEQARAKVAEGRHEIGRQQKRLEDEVALIEDRRTSENDRLYSGSVTAHKDLQAIQDELDVLADRQGNLEEQVLELMEAAEPIDAQLADFDAKLDAVAARRTVIEGQLAESQAAIDAEIADERTARSAALDGVSDELVAEYERVRSTSAGVGVARLNAKTCEGCHLQLSAVDYDRIRKESADTVVHCPECGRLLVR